MRLKIKKLVTVNYFLFALAIAGAWFLYIQTPRHFNTTKEQIDNIKHRFEKKLDFSIEMKANNIQEHPKLESVYNDLVRYPLEQQAKRTIYGPTGGAPNVRLSIECNKADKTNTLTISSFSDFVFRGDCAQLENSKTLQKDLSRAIYSLTQGIDEERNLNLAFELVHINIYLIVATKDQKQTESIKKKLVDTAVPFFKKIGLSQSQYRLNFQTLFTEDLNFTPTFTANDSQTLNVKEVEQFVDSFPSISQEQIYTFETEDVNLYLFIDKDISFAEGKTKSTYFDEIKEKYAVFSVNPQGANNEVIFLRTLYRMFELNTLQSLSSSLQNLKLKYDSNVEFAVFNEKRTKFLIKKIVNGLEYFKYVIDDGELVVEKDIGERIDDQINRISLLNVDSLNIRDLQDIYRVLFSLNYDGNHKYAHRDSFSDEYRIGVYLPILLPFLFPVVKALKKLKAKKKN